MNMNDVPKEKEIFTIKTKDGTEFVMMQKKEFERLTRPPELRERGSARSMKSFADILASTMTLEDLPF